MHTHLSQLYHWQEKDLYFGVDSVRKSGELNRENHTFWHSWGYAQDKVCSPRLYISKDGIMPFFNVLDKVDNFDRDEDTYVAFLAIKAPEDMEAWDLFPRFTPSGAEYSWNKYVEHHRNFKSEKYIFYPIPDERLLVAMSMTFTVKSGKIYSPVGISKSIFALLLDENIKILKKADKPIPAQISRLSALSVRFHAMTAHHILTNIDNSIHYCITRPVPVMSFIIMKAMNDTFVSLGSVSDRTFIEKMRQDYPGSTSHMGKHNGLGDVVDIMKASGPPVLDDSDKNWQVTSFDTDPSKTLKLKQPMYWSIIEDLYGIKSLPIIVVDCRELAKLSPSTQQHDLSMELLLVVEAMHRRLNKLESQL